MGAKLGGVSAFRVVSTSRVVAPCKVARLKASKRQDRQDGLSQRQQKDRFCILYWVSEATLGSFRGHFWSGLDAKLGGLSAFRVVSINRAVTLSTVARLKA